MRLKGLEPLHLAAQGPKPCVSTNSTTIATSRVDNCFYLIVNKIKKLKILLRGAERVCARSGSGQSTDKRARSEYKPRGCGLGQRNIFFYFVCSTTMYPLSNPLTAAFMARYRSSTSTQTHVPRWPATSIISALSLPS